MKELIKLKESDIQNLILDWLNKNRIFSFRVNNVGVYDPVKNIYRQLGKFSLKGISDIMGVLPDGRFLAIEVKTKTGKVSKDQNAFIHKVNKTGGLAFVSRSLEDTIEQLAQNGYDF